MRNVPAWVSILAVVVVCCVLLVTDTRARAEVRRTTDASTSTETHLRQRQTDLHSAQGQTKATAVEIQTLETSILQVRTNLATSNAAISSTERGLFLGGIDIASLNTCLVGVTQALDQVAVGQTIGALSSLGSVSTSCNSAKVAGR
jgi:capsule polysaccharide export protein KpsE/RkpR